MKKFLFFIFLFLSSGIAFSQISDSTNTEDFIFQNTNFDSEGSSQAILENMYFQQIERNINLVTKEELIKTGIFSDIQADSIVSRRKKAGNFLSIYELQSIEGISVQQAKIASFYFTLNSQTNWIQQKNRFYAKYGIINNEKYQYGNSQVRLKLINTKNDFNLLLDNDLGEKYRWNPSKNTFGFDFTSMYYKYEKKSNTNYKIILGDYRIQTGEGLVFGGGYYLSKAGDPIMSTIRGSQGIIPSQSSLEYGYLRGIASSWKYRKAKFLIGTSLTQRDAKLQDSLDQLSSIYNTGYHISESEWNNKATRNEFGAFWNTEFQLKNGYLGFNHNYTHWNFPISKSNLLYKKSDYTHSDLLIQSIYGMKKASFAIIKYEFAYQFQVQKVAKIINLLLPLNDKLEFSFLYRNYPNQFYSNLIASFAESYDRTNEVGLYSAMKYKINYKTTFSGFVDFYNREAPLYLQNNGKYGIETMARLQWDKTKNASLFAQVKYQKFSNEFSNEAFSYFRSSEEIQKWILSVKYTEKITKKLQYQTGIVSNYYTGIHDGLAIWQSLQCRIKQTQISVKSVWFNCEDYNSRIYLPEQDMAFQFYMPMLYGKGFRNMILFKQKIGKKTSLGLKFYKSGGKVADSGCRVQLMNEF